MIDYGQQALDKCVEKYGDKYEYLGSYIKNKKKLCEEKGVKLLYFSKLNIKYPYKVFEDKNELLNEIKNG